MAEFEQAGAVPDAPLAQTSREQRNCGHGKPSYYETQEQCPVRESITRSHVTRDLSPQRVFDSSPIDCMASLPDLFKQKGGLESLRPLAGLDESKKDCGEGKEEYKPRALQRLEAILADKLFNAGRTARLLGPEGPGYSTCLLECQAYRQAFDAFIQSFTTYRPLLMKIKKEYDVAFEDALKAAHENIHMRADLVEAQRQREHRVEEGKRMIYESAAKQRSEIQETIKQLKAQIDLSTAMAREAEDETYAFRVRVQAAKKEAKTLQEESKAIRRQLVEGSAWKGIQVYTRGHEAGAILCNQGPESL